MHKRWLAVLLTTCVLAMPGCATKSPLLRPVVCPAVPPLPANLKAPLNAEQSLSELLLQSGAPATPE